jgi:DNA-binding MarR family transcriptional regulator
MIGFTRKCCSLDSVPKRIVQPEQLLRGVGYTLSQLSRMSRDVVGGPLESEGFSLRAHWVLNCLRQKGELSQQQVCDALGIDRSDMVRLVDDLEQRGLVIRTKDSRDRRKHLLSLTKDGKAASKRTTELVERATDEALAALSPIERQLLHRLTLKALGQPEHYADIP